MFSRSARVMVTQYFFLIFFFFYYYYIIRYSRSFTPRVLPCRLQATSLWFKEGSPCAQVWTGCLRLTQVLIWAPCLPSSQRVTPRLLHGACALRYAVTNDMDRMPGLAGETGKQPTPPTAHPLGKPCAAAARQGPPRSRPGGAASTATPQKPSLPSTRKFKTLPAGQDGASYAHI